MGVISMKYLYYFSTKWFCAANVIGMNFEEEQVRDSE